MTITLRPESRSTKKIYGSQSFEIKDPESRFTRIEDHDVSLWLGDLNFRLEDLTGNEILQKIVSADTAQSPDERRSLIDGLLEHDQLTKSRRLEKAFNDYQEATINFSPTYKFTVWSNEYDLGRKPSWCDRVLYKTKGSSAIIVSPYDYRSYPQFSQSDHKPVSKFFSISTPKRILKSKREIRSPSLKFITPTDWRINHDAVAFYTFDDREGQPDQPRYMGEERRASEPGRTSRRSSQNAQLKTYEFDWIGLYPANFTDLEEPITFVWANHESVENLPGSTNRSQATSSFNPMASTSSNDSTDSTLSNQRFFKVTFSELVLLKPGHFRLLYFNEDGQLRTMSEPFQITS